MLKRSVVAAEYTGEVDSSLLSSWGFTDIKHICQRWSARSSFGLKLVLNLMELIALSGSQNDVR